MIRYALALLLMLLSAPASAETLTGVASAIDGDTIERAPPKISKLGQTLTNIGEILPWHVKAVDGFCESVVVAVADTTDGGFKVGLGEAFRVFDRQVLGRFNRSSQSL